jgi:uncharacterized protein
MSDQIPQVSPSNSSGEQHQAPSSVTSQDSGKMSRAEAGRKGGQTTKQRYGDEHFGRIGKIGGKKGGETTKQRYGSEFYREIGRIGGSK